MSKDIPTADVLEWCKKRNYALVAREDFPYLFKDIVKCGECKWWDYSTSGCERIHPLAPFRDDDFCSYGEKGE